MNWKFVLLTLLMILFGASCSLGANPKALDNLDQDSISPPESEFGSEPSQTPPASLKNIWRQPAADSTWQWQLTGEIETSYDVDLYDLDLFETDPALIQELKAEGRYLVCYLSAGSWEDWRPDADQFPPGSWAEITPAGRAKNGSISARSLL